jgi:hypothetical protein
MHCTKDLAILDIKNRVEDPTIKKVKYLVFYRNKTKFEFIFLNYKHRLQVTKSVKKSDRIHKGVKM